MIDLVPEAASRAVIPRSFVVIVVAVMLLVSSAVFAMLPLPE